MSLPNKTPPPTAAPQLSSDQAALERAGKKQVLKVQLRVVCFSEVADCLLERMELLGRAGFLVRDFGYLGVYERSILRCIY